MNQRLIELAENDLMNAQDNLRRARLSATEANLNKRYGQSGATLADIISGYEQWEVSAQEALRIAKGQIA